jgi:Zn-dependent M28 family amino/carboxypeptidase
MRVRTLLKGVVLCLVLTAAGVFVVVQPLARPIASRPPPADPKRLEAHTRHLSIDLFPRSFDQRQKLDLAAEYIEAELRGIGADVARQEVLVDGEKYRNVIARFGPETGPLLVIGAHYDSHGDETASEVTSQSHTPGADDNASGIAGLLELARLLGENPPTRPVELVAYTLEEPPHFRTRHMGSAWHAHSLRTGKRKVELMVSLEMIGYFSDRPGSQRYPVPAMSRLYPDRGNFIAIVGKLSGSKSTRHAKAILSGATDLPVHSINAPPLLVQGIDFSDHLSYWREGFPAIMITDTAFLRNPNYHQSGDTYDKLDYERMAKVVQGVYALVQNY